MSKVSNRYSSGDMGRGVLGTHTTTPLVCIRGKVPPKYMSLMICNMSPLIIGHRSWRKSVGTPSYPGALFRFPRHTAICSSASVIGC
jgi:hypothetical protein